MIRKMTQEDAVAAAELDAEAFSEPWDAEEFSAELSKDYAFYCIAEPDGIPAGYAGIWCVYETAELVRIGVAPEHRRRGVAAELMERVLAYAAAAGCEKMMLEVRAGNAPARALYTKYGFSGISVRKGYYDGEDAVIMERYL